MARTLLFCALALAAMPLLAGSAEAQERSASIRASASVQPPATQVALRPDTGRAAEPVPATRRVRLPGLAVVDVQHDRDAAVRVTPREAERAVRVTIEYVANE